DLPPERFIVLAHGALQPAAWLRGSSTAQIRPPYHEPEPSRPSESSCTQQGLRARTTAPGGQRAVANSLLQAGPAPRETRWAGWNLVRTQTSTAAFGCLAWALGAFGQS